jgi:hypothetical protein
VLGAAPTIFVHFLRNWKKTGKAGGIFYKTKKERRHDNII